MIIPTLLVKCPESCCQLIFPVNDIGQKSAECPNCFTNFKIKEEAEP